MWHDLYYEIDKIANSLKSVIVKRCVFARCVESCQKKKYVRQNRKYTLIKPYKIIPVPALTYDSGMRVLSKKDMNTILGTKKFLRWVMGILKE